MSDEELVVQIREDLFYGDVSRARSRLDSIQDAARRQAVRAVIDEYEQ